MAGSHSYMCDCGLKTTWGAMVEGEGGELQGSGDQVLAGLWSQPQTMEHQQQTWGTGSCRDRISRRPMLAEDILLGTSEHQAWSQCEAGACAIREPQATIIILIMKQ